MPKGASVPCIVLSRTSTDDTYAMSGSMKFRGALFQFDCYAASYYPSRQLGDIVRHLLESYTGPLPDGTVVSGIQICKDFDFPFEEGGKGFVYRAMIEARVWYQDN